MRFLVLLIPPLLACTGPSPHGSGSANAGAADAAGAGGTGGAGGIGGAEVVDYCACAEPTTAGVVAATAVKEASGLASSARFPGVYYVHNDSGDVPRFFAVGASGEARGEFAVTKASAVDWEDMARGPCDDGTGSCLYLADIGDNEESRSDYTLYRVAEPDAVGADGSLVAEALGVAYPDGSHNAETLLVHPTTGVVTIVTKVADGASTVYVSPGPLHVGATTPLMAVGTLAAPSGSAQFTGGDVHPSARGVLLRTYSHAWFFSMAPGQTVAEALLAAPCSARVALETQGEAIAWTADGQGYTTVSEGPSPGLHTSACGP